jgi:TetR/AcrR family transcriptional regulator, mexCD-oprJ operon repressor
VTKDTASPRADARRNIAAILAAARQCLVRDPGASVGEIAKAAGVGRVTLYGHFPSRSELVDAVLADAIAEAEQGLESVDLTGNPGDALARLIGSSWQIVHQFRMLLAAAQRELPPERIRAHHAQPLRRVERLVRSGRRSGVFRTDLPTAWLVAVFYTTIHGAADEIAAGRLPAQDAPRAITAILLSAFRPQ